MSIFLYISGLLIGIAVFIYILSIHEKTKEKISQLTEKNKPEPHSINIKTENIGFNKRPPLPPGTRICPLCGSSLEKYEGLYASKIIRGDSASILIMGCKYCYKEPEKSSQYKQSAI